MQKIINTSNYFSQLLTLLQLSHRLLPKQVLLSKWLFIGLGLTLLPLFSIAQYSGETMIDKIVAKVDNYIVLQSDLEAAYREAQANPNFGDITKCQVLQQLVVEKLMLAKAEIDSVVVEDARVDLDLDRRMQYMIGNYGEETIEQQFGKSVEELKEEMRDDIRELLVMMRSQSGLARCGHRSGTKPSATIALTPMRIHHGRSRLRNSLRRCWKAGAQD